MKIKAKNSKVASMKLIVPIDGAITIDGNGVADVSPKCAVALVTSTNDWEYLSKSKISDNAAEADDEASDEEDDAVDEERKKFDAHLDTLKLDQMKSLAEEGDMPREEWEKINSKKLMKAYLLKKYDEAEADDEASDEEEE